MDPITQGALGAAAAQLKSPKHLIQAAIVGALAGMAPDLDILIRSANDPLLALEFHRHFTHSLLFIPLGALIFAGLFYLLLKRFLVLSFLNVFWWSLLGIATHGILDGCTSYGTQLFWPFSNARISFDIVSVVDPFFTFPLLALVIFSALKRSRRYAVIGLSWSCIYLFLGYVQRERAIIEGAELAVS
ncbi:MAG: inner membrane protein, partial [Flavobacteriales bacterium]